MGSPFLCSGAFRSVGALVRAGGAGQGNRDHHATCTALLGVYSGFFFTSRAAARDPLRIHDANTHEIFVVAIATPPALPLVRLSLCPYRIHLRQSRFLPLQRGGNLAAAAHRAGCAAPGLAARGTHESVCAYAGYGVGDALSTAA